MPCQDLTPPPAPVAVDLKSSPNQPLSLPLNLTPLAAAFRFIEPTWRNYIMYVDLEARTGNLDAERYLKCWQALSGRERQIHMPEQLCDLSSTPASDLIRWVSGQAWQESAAKSSMCMSFMRDKVLEKTGEYAMASPDNYRHADLFMRVSGVLPVSSGRGGPAVAIFNAPTASSGSVAGVVSESAPVDRSGLRDMDAEIVELSRVMQTGDTHCAAEVKKDDKEDEDDDDDESDEDE